MKKYILSLLVVHLAFLISATQAYAVCPVCTVAVGTGLGISRWLGIDDTITSIWIGGLILSSGLWLANWIEKKGWKVPYKEFVSVGLFLIFVIIPLYWTGLIGLPGNTLWGIDKVLLGTSVGLILFLIGMWLDKILRKMNNGKVYIYYQKVILPVLLLTIGSFMFYLILD